jgi:hypothetical protein
MQGSLPETDTLSGRWMPSTMLPMRPGITQMGDKSGGRRRTGAKLDAERFAGAQDGVADCDTGCLFVDLDCYLICVDSDDLFGSDERDASGGAAYSPPTSSSWPTRTSSYIADPAMFSATTTGPETPYTEPYLDSRSSSRIRGSSAVDMGGCKYTSTRRGRVPLSSSPPCLQKRELSTLSSTWLTRLQRLGKVYVFALLQHAAHPSQGKRRMAKTTRRLSVSVHPPARRPLIAAALDDSDIQILKTYACCPHPLRLAC